MPFVEWELQGVEAINCNCNSGCPCQFNQLPTHGHCRAHMWMQIDKGHFGTVKLDGLRFGVVAAWPGPIHKGGGTHQVIVDERATAEQAKAIETIAKGQETEPGKIVWWIYATMSTTFLPTIAAAIDLKIDMEARESSVSVPGVVEGSISPVKHAVTGLPSRARIVLPAGVEYTEAEVASGTAKTSGPIEIDFKGTHAHFARFHWSTHGVIR